ncbi:galactoside alpha-(1,2)-fucosyltransferase 2 isoform X1 [Anabrus simplex]|uniref:galactoside alpha-(1,2)-fucosyltransferase 2 isoform X1 n=1 Tax=Anabrus simplex TaxID=316456 RepID=UPI0035A2FFA6
MRFFNACHRSMRSMCFFLLSLLVFMTCATFVIYQQDIYLTARRSFYVYEFPNKDVPYPTLFLANKKRMCVPDATVTVQSGGRLGNLIMEYASTWSVAKIYNLTAFVPLDILHRLQDVFQPLSIPSIRLFLKKSTSCPPGKIWGKTAKEIVGTMKKIDMKQAPLHSIVEMARNRHKLIVLELCVIMVETIVPLAQELREEFKYKSKLQEAAQKSLRQFRDKLMKGNKNSDEQVIFVGVHVRRTDYKDQIKLLYNATEEAGVVYYQRAVSWMRSTLSEEANGRAVNIAFIVTSDDPTWCQETLIPALSGPSDDSLGQFEVYWGGQGDITTPEQDLSLLSACNHSIISYGTYGIWAALMAGGHTVVYDITGSEGNRHVHGYTPAMQFARNMEGWIALW